MARARSSYAYDLMSSGTKNSLSTLRMAESTRSSLMFCKPGSDFGEWEGIQHILFGEPAFACDPDAERHDVQAFHTVSVGVDADLDAQFLRLGKLAPIDVKAMGARIQFHSLPEVGRRTQDFLLVHGIAVAFKQQS